MTSNPSTSLLMASHESSSENTNFFRLLTLLIEGGRQALMEALISRLPNGKSLDESGITINLKNMLKNNQGTLHDLKIRKILKPPQWDLLYPQPVIEKWDISLLFILLRNVCNFRPNDPLWENDPLDSDFSVQADVVRLKKFRNVLQGHSAEAKLSDVEFSETWNGIADVIIRLSHNCNLNSKMRTMVSETLKMSLDVRREQEILSQLLDWISTDNNEDITKCLHQLDKKLEQVTKFLSDKGETVIKDVQNLVRQMENRLKLLDQNMENIDSNDGKYLISQIADEVVGGVYNIVTKAENKILTEMRNIMYSSSGKELLQQILDHLKELERKSLSSSEIQRNLTRESQTSWNRIEQKVDHLIGRKHNREDSNEDIIKKNFREDSGFDDTGFTEENESLMKKARRSGEMNKHKVLLSCGCCYSAIDLKQFCNFLAKIGHCSLQCFKCEEVWSIAEIRDKTGMTTLENEHSEKH